MSGSSSLPERGRPVLALGAALLALVVLLDTTTDADVVPPSMYLLPGLVAALVARARLVAALAGAGLALAFASGLWNDEFLEVEHLGPVAVVAIGGALAVAIARARAAATASRRAAEAAEARAHAGRRRSEVLARLARIAEDGAARERALEQLGDLLVPEVADVAWVDLVEGDGLRRSLVRGEGAADETLSAAVVASGATEQATAEDGSWRVAVPLAAGGASLGALGVGAGADRPLSVEDERLLETLAGRAALVLTNAGLLAELASARRRLDGVLGVLAEAVTVNDDAGDMVYANPAAVRLLGAETVDEVLGTSPEELAGRFVISREDGSAVEIEDLPGHQLVAGLPVRPLLTRSVQKKTGREFWLLTKATILEDEGRRFAVNIIEDVTEAKQAELRQRVLAEAGRVLGVSLEPERALSQLAELLTARFADWCSIDLVDASGATVQVALAHADPEKVRFARELRERYPPDPDAPGGAGEVQRTGRPLLMNDIPPEVLEAAAEDEGHLALLQELGMRAAIVVPVRFGERVLGTMTLVSAESGRTFTDADLTFALDVAGRIAAAVDNARLYSERAEIAETLQRSLLPERLPTLAGWEVAAGYAAGELAAEVGGDFYDVFGVDGGTMVLLGDVTGRGIAAAALTSLVRHSAAAAARFVPRPEVVLRLVNEVLRDQSRVAPVTAVCGLLREEADGGATFAVCCAGHPPPLLRRGGTSSRVGRPDLLLGAVDDHRWDTQIVELLQDDVLVLHTDGVTDARGGAGRFGADRLHAAIDGAGPSAQDVLDAVESAVTDFELAGRADDRAILVLRRVASGG